jgi:hypothetical protein
VTDIGEEKVVENEQSTRYANTLSGRLCHAETAGKTGEPFLCAVCGDGVLLVSAVGAGAFFRHVRRTTCTGRYPCEQAPDLIAELGDKPWWIAFDANWQASGWSVRTVRLTWTREGYLPDADAERGERKILLTGTHTPDPVAAIESVRVLLDDVPCRISTRTTIGDHSESP